MMRAGLPMYDLPELQAVTEAFWNRLASHMRAEGIADVPARIEHPTDYDAHWLEPGLLLSQTCGYPMRHRLKGRVTYVATPSYAVEGCGRGTYRSAIVVRVDAPIRKLDDLRGATAAFNDMQSQSGMNALRAAVAPFSREGRFFDRVIESGRHEASIRAVADGEADVAAIDCVTWAYLERYRPSEVAALHVLDMTAEMPGLPFVTAGDAGEDLVAKLRAALTESMLDPAIAVVRDALFLSGIVILPDDAYLAIDRMAEGAVARGYPQLA
ncbi:MAG: PhnD/SsuA/transferrin family substrate-binding protein [Rhodospirillaceae bacterium]|nr:PhnD/SsuA/transferrin family substrate-binding protein [Rhodospirillaceae bacterium]